MQNSTSGPYVAPVFSPPPYAVAINALFFASLGIVLVAAFLCMLVKGWIRELDRRLLGIPDLQKRAVIKELREQGLIRWRLPEMITILPSLIYISLFLFFIGLALYLLRVHKTLAFLLISIFGLGVLLYVLSIFISVVDDFSPFRSMYSRALGVLYRRLYSRLTSPFISHSSFLIAMPQTSIEKIRERISMFITKHKPLSEQAPLDPSLSSTTKIFSKTSTTALNKLWGTVGRGDTSTYAKDISTSIMHQLDDFHIRPFHYFPWAYETSSPSIKEAVSITYSTCMMRPGVIHRSFVKAVRAAHVVIQQPVDPWFHLVASLSTAWVEGAERDLSKRSRPAYERDHVVRLRGLSIAGREADILRAISNVRIFSAEQWCFVLCSIYTLFVPEGGRLMPEEIRALTKILARLLQKGMHHIQGSTICLNAHTDFWLYVTLSVVDREVSNQLMSELKSSGEILHVRDIGVYGHGMTRDPTNFRRLLQLSREHDLDPSLMRRCLISILYILISFGPSTQQQIRLVDQYMEISAEEMGLIDWNLDLSRLLTNEDIQTFYLSQTVFCLLKGRCPHSLHRYDPADAAPAIMWEYDLKLANAQPTPEILKVMSEVMFAPSRMTGLELQNPWLSIYACNLTRSSHYSEIPSIWSPGCTSIASKRLDLYDRGAFTPEIDLITFFLSCPSPSIACRALRWYLRLEENAIASGGTQHLSAIFPTIFRKGLSTDEYRMSWLFLIDVLLPSLGSMSLQWKGYFVETFFGYGSLGGNNQAVEARPTADGLGWMEDVWATVLRRLVIHIDRAETYWPELSRMMHTAPPESARETEPTSPSPLNPRVTRDAASEATLMGNRVVLGPQTIEEHLADSAKGALEVLAQLLESGTGLMPAVLLNCLRDSPLLSDERLQHDTRSLHRIRRILDQ